MHYLDDRVNRKQRRVHAGSIKPDLLTIALHARENREVVASQSRRDRRCRHFAMTVINTLSLLPNPRHCYGRLC